MTIVALPTPRGGTERFVLSAGPAPEPGRGWPRVAYAAAHVVADPSAPVDPGAGVAIDWDATMAFRRHLWSLGFGVAEAMDTAQRGMGLAWDDAIELIRRSTAEAPKGALIASGAGTDHLDPVGTHDLDAVTAAYEMQCEAVEAAGSRVILMASRALVRAARGPEDYADVYARVLSGLERPAILHWLGAMFDPALTGYWGMDGEPEAMQVCVDVIADNAAKVDGIKVSLLSAEKEVALRRRLPAGVRMYTGDDYNYPDLIEGDERGHSDALLGILDPIAVPAARALTALGAGDRMGWRAVIDPTVPLARHVFGTPTRFYKTGVVFLAYLMGHQDHFTMVGGQESARSTLHLASIVRLAEAAGLFFDPDVAAARAAAVFRVRGVA